MDIPSQWFLGEEEKSKVARAEPRIPSVKYRRQIEIGNISQITSIT
jgi:hypothetical protein